MSGKTARGVSQARERVLTAAYDLFSRQGVRAVGIDTITAVADVGKMTFYSHLHYKDELVLAFLQRREQLWTREWLETQVESRAAGPRDRLLAIFDVFDEWFQRDDFEGCSFINVLLEMLEPGNPVRRATTAHLANIKVFLRALAVADGVSGSAGFPRKWHVLTKVSIQATSKPCRHTNRRPGV